MENFIYLTRFDDMPPIRIDMTQMVTFPLDNINQFKYTKWFYHSLRCGKKMPFNVNIKKPIVKKSIKQKKTKKMCDIKDFIVDDGYSYEDSEYIPKCVRRHSKVAFEYSRTLINANAFITANPQGFDQKRVRTLIYKKSKIFYILIYRKRYI